jgi:large subunit ribosomal protein L15
MDLFRNLRHKKSKRVARGGKRGTTAGRGTKGQKSRAGRRIRPAGRDLLIRLPKLRGYKNKSIKEKPRALNLGDLAKFSETIFTKENLGNVKILGNGELQKSVIIRGLPLSKNARQKIEKAGGKVE